MSDNERIIVYVEPDYDAEGPCEYDGWKVHSFNRRHSNYSHPSDLGLDEDGGADQPDLNRKLKEGLAFRLSYFEHGMCEWSLAGEGYQCAWDSVGFAGLLIWEDDPSNMGAKTYEDRQKDARHFLETYTDWCNGAVFGYRAVKVRDCPTCDQEEVVDDCYDSCWGFIGGEALHAGIVESLGEGPFEIRGEARGVLDDAPCAKG